VEVDGDPRGVWLRDSRLSGSRLAGITPLAWRDPPDDRACH